MEENSGGGSTIQYLDVSIFVYGGFVVVQSRFFHEQERNVKNPII